MSRVMSCSCSPHLRSLAINWNSLLTLPATNYSRLCPVDWHCKTPAYLSNLLLTSSAGTVDPKAVIMADTSALLSHISPNLMEKSSLWSTSLSVCSFVVGRSMFYRVLHFWLLLTLSLLCIFLEISVWVVESTGSSLVISCPNSGLEEVRRLSLALTLFSIVMRKDGSFPLQLAFFMFEYRKQQRILLSQNFAVAQVDLPSKKDTLIWTICNVDYIVQSNTFAFCPRTRLWLFSGWQVFFFGDFWIRVEFYGVIRKVFLYVFLVVVTVGMQ